MVTLIFKFLSRIHDHVTTQVQGNAYTHVIRIRLYISVYVYAGVLNYETVYHTSSIFGIWYASIMKFVLNKFVGIIIINVGQLLALFYVIRIFIYIR